MQAGAFHAADAPDGARAWLRLATALAASTLGGVGMWSVVVVLPAVAAEFGAARADASLPYTLTMVGFGLGSAVMGGLADRFGIARTIALAAVALGAGYILAGLAPNLWLFALAQGVLIGFLGASATFAPLVADVSHWFLRRRGIAVAICASGNYLAGTLWPPLIQHFVDGVGWRQTQLGIGAFCLLTMLPLALLLRRKPPPLAPDPLARPAAAEPAASLRTTQLLLIVAGLACCVAMSMPQVHIVAYCADLGYGPARGTQMLSLMLGFGVASRIASGFIADRLGGLPTVLIGSALQAFALLLYFLFDGLASLYVISILFGLFQGGIVPSYAIVVRERFPPREAGARIGAVLMATIFGMALGGWMSGAIFDLTGSYRAAFANGFAWNLANVAIVLWLMRPGGRRRAPAPPVAGRAEALT